MSEHIQWRRTPATCIDHHIPDPGKHRPSPISGTIGKLVSYCTCLARGYQRPNWKASKLCYLVHHRDRTFAWHARQNAEPTGDPAIKRRFHNCRIRCVRRSTHRVRCPMESGGRPCVRRSPEHDIFRSSDFAIPGRRHVSCFNATLRSSTRLEQCLKPSLRIRNAHVGKYNETPLGRPSPWFTVGGLPDDPFGCGTSPSSRDLYFP